MPALQYLALAVDQQHIGYTHLAPVQALRVDQVPVGCHLHREMVADTFVEAQLRGPAQGGGQVSILFSLSCRT